MGRRFGMRQLKGFCFCFCDAILWGVRAYVFKFNDLFIVRWMLLGFAANETLFYFLRRETKEDFYVISLFFLSLTELKIEKIRNMTELIKSRALITKISRKT